MLGEDGCTDKKNTNCDEQWKQLYQCQTAALAAIFGLYENHNRLMWPNAQKLSGGHVKGNNNLRPKRESKGAQTVGSSAVLGGMMNSIQKVI
jgi:hypothetical protein